MTVYCCKSPFCNCEFSESESSCSCHENKKHDSCCCCCHCCCDHHHNDCGRDERVCYPVAVESFDCCSCWSRC